MKQPPGKISLPFRRQFRWNLTAYSLLLAVIPMLFVAYIVLTGEYQQTVGSVTNQLESVATLKQNQINFWLNQVNAGANRTLVNVNGPAVELTIVSSEKLEMSRSILNSILRQLTRVNDLFDETFVYTLNGEVLAASNEVRVGQRVTAQPYFQASLTGDYLQSPYYELGSSALTMVATRPIIDEDGRIAAVMAVRLNLDILGQIMAERAGLGETGETYLVSSESNYLLTPSRFEGYIQTRAYHSEGIDSVLTGQNGAGTYPDYRGEPVIGVYKWIPELNAGLLAEINEDEALVSYYEAARASGWAMAIAGLAAAFTALYYANRVAKPIAALTRTAEQIAGGDLSQRAHIRSRNEIGLLAQAFNSMAEQLQEFIGSLESRVAARTRELALTLEVGHLATSLYTQKDLLTSLVNFIRDQFDLYYTQIYLLDEAGLHAVLRAGTGEVGQQLLARNHRLNLSETSLVARAVQTNQPVLVADTQTSAIHKANPLLPDTRSEVTIPLVVGSVIIGVLDMQSNREGTFNQENLPVFEAMASQIASALRGSQAFEEAQAAIQRAEMVNRRLTEETWDSYLGQLGEGRCLGYQYDLEAPRPLEPHSNGHDDGSRIVQPVFLRGQPIGKIVIAEDTERQWKPEEMLLVEDVAKRVAQALDQFRAFDQIKQAEAETRRRASELETVAQVSAVTASILEVDQLLQQIADLTKERFNLYHAHIYLLDEASKSLVLAAGAGETGRFMKAEGHAIRLDHPHSLVARAARQQQAVVVNNVSRSPDFLPNPLLPDTKAELAIPMLVGGQLIGILDLQASVINRFTENDVRVKTTLAEQAAIAIQNARLFQWTQDALAQTETLYNASQGLLHAQSLENVLRAFSEPILYEAPIDVTLFETELDASGQPLNMEVIARIQTAENMPETPIGTRYPFAVFPILQHLLKNPRQLLIIEDVHQPHEWIDEVTAKVFERQNVQAIAFIPLVTAQGRWNGVVTFSWPQTHVFSEKNRQLYTVLASQLATVLDNRRLFQETQDALAEVRQNAELIRTVIDATPDWIFAKDRDYRYILVNQRYADGIGLNPQDMLGKDDLELGFPEELVLGNPDKGISGFRTDDTTVLTTGQMVHNPYDPVIFADGSQHILDTQKLPLRDAEGHTFAVLGFGRDITERLKAEQTLKESEARLSEAVRIAKIGYWEYDFATEAFTFTDSFYDLIGTSIEAEGSYVMSAADYARRFVHPSDAPAVGMLTQEAMETTDPNFSVSLESRSIRADGRQAIDLVQFRVVKDEHGRTIKLVGANQDITERKLAEQEIARRAAELQTVAEVSAATTTILDVDELLLAVSDLTKERFNLYHAHIYLLDDLGENLVLAAGAGEAGRTMKAEGRSIRLDHPNSLVAHAARDKQGVVVNDITQTPDFLPNPLLPDTKAELAVPMLVGDQLIGVLDVQASVTDRFTSEDVRVQTTLAAQVAVAIQNARAFAEARRQATIIETSRDFISLADPQGTIVYLNTGGAKMIGYDNPAEIIGKPIPFVHFPEDSQRVQEEGLPKALETGYWQGENGLKHRDGRRIPVDQTIFVIRDDDGEIINIATIMTDISERKQAQAVLEENEARFRSLVSNVPGIIYRCAIDEYWTMQFIGPAIADLTGYPDTDFIQNNVRSYASIIHPDDTAKVDEAVWRGVENRMPYEIEYRLVHADGTVRWVNERGQAVYGQDGTPLWLDGAVFDITESKRAEAEREQLLAEMQRNARLIRTVIDATPDWIFAKDRDYRYILANQGYANAIGTTTDGIVGKTDVELGFPEEIVFGNPDKGIRGFRSDDEAVLTTGEAIYNPYDPATFADGSIHIFDTQKMPLRDAAGHTFAVLGFARDITLRQQQEEEVRLAREEAEILYKVSSAINEAKNPLEIVDAILAHAAPPVEPSVAVTHNDTGDSTTARYVNILAGRLSDGRTISNMNIALDDFGGGFSAPNELRCIADIETDPSLTEEARWAYRALNAASVLSAPLEIGGRVVGTLSITTGQPYHYTERDQRIYAAIAEQVAAAMERLQLIQETQKRATEMETVARVSAATTTILDVEELLQAVCDLTKERFRLYHTHIYLLDETGQKLTLAAGAGDAGRIMKAEGRFIPINHPNSLVARAARERRGIIANDVTQEPDFLANPLLPLTQSELAVPMIVASELIGVLDVQSEILSRFTEEDVWIKTTLADQVSIAIQNARAFRVQQEAAERLREVDRLKSQFLANMSHELRTPLNSIIGYAEVMLDGIDGELTDDAIEDVEAIHSGGKHLLAIINDILDLAKIDAGQMFMDRQEADLGKIVEEVVHTCQILVKDKGIYLELERQAELPPVYGDPVRLRQIVYNLVNNAIKFTEKGGITVSIGRQDDQQICVTVKDTGIGMSQKDLSVIFERFRQVDGSATRRAGGTGLGLAITRQLVQMHDGEIHVTSKPHEGSTFWFTLPVYEGQKA